MNPPLTARKLEFGSGACARAMRHVVPLSHRRQAVFHAQLALCMKYMPAACMKSLTLTHEGLEFGFAKFPFTGLLAQTLGRV